MGKTKRLLYRTKLAPDSPKRTEGLLLSQNNYFSFLLSFFSLQSTKNKKTLANFRENTLSETCKGLFGFVQDGATSLLLILYSTELCNRLCLPRSYGVTSVWNMITDSCREKLLRVNCSPFQLRGPFSPSTLLISFSIK